MYELAPSNCQLQKKDSLHNSTICKSVSFLSSFLIKAREPQIVQISWRRFLSESVDHRHTWSNSQLIPSKYILINWIKIYFDYEKQDLPFLWHKFNKQYNLAQHNNKRSGWIIWTFVYNLYNVGPTSSTLVQHCINVIQMFCVHRVVTCTCRITSNKVTLCMKLE